MINKLLHNFSSQDSYNKFLTIFAISGIIMTTYYWFFGFSILLSIIFGAIGLKYLIDSVPKRLNTKFNLKDFILKQRKNWLVYLSILLQTGVIYLLITRRTGQTLTSPWIIFGPKFFTLFFLSIFTTIISFRTEASEKLKKFTRTEGQILVKLIHRQTGKTSFELVKELRTGWKAFWYNTTASLFDISLKVKYDPFLNKEDYLIEDILERSFQANILERQDPAFPIDLLDLSAHWNRKAVNK